MSLRLFVLPGFLLNFPIPTAGLNSNLPKPVGAVPPQGIELLNFVPLTGRKTQRFAGSLIPDAESGAPEENSLDISVKQTRCLLQLAWICSIIHALRGWLTSKFLVRFGLCQSMSMCDMDSTPQISCVNRQPGADIHSSAAAGLDGAGRIMGGHV